MKKVIFLVPHLSTGGMPQYTYDLMRKIQADVDVYCIEYSIVSTDFVVQRNRIINLLGDKFFCLGEDKYQLFELIDKINPDIVHLQEMPEYFLPSEISDKLYSKTRNYFIVETSHDSSFQYTSKRYYPDHLALISEYQRNEFSKLGIPIDLVESDIEYKQRQDRTDGLLKLGLDPTLKHVLNVGLFTPRKNQAEIMEYAKTLENEPIQFHFVGNQADNFADYWKPLLDNLPSNVKVWGERSDVDNFYSCMDLMLFTSRGNGNDKETSPLVIRESIGYNLPALIYNLPVYLNMYDKYETITYLTDDKNFNIKLIMDKLELNYNNEQQLHGMLTPDPYRVNFEGETNKLFFSPNYDLSFTTLISIKDIDSKACIYSLEIPPINQGNVYWAMPLPTNVISFKDDATFGGFLIEFYYIDSDSPYQIEQIRIKDISIHKPVMNLSKTEPIFNNYAEFFVDDIYKKFDINGCSTVIDAGANIGLWTEYILKRGAKHVYCLEPNRKALTELEKNMRRHDNVTIIATAIGPENGKIQFYEDENSLISSIYPTNSGTLNEVDCMTFDTILDKVGIDKIDLLKMDIEGAEFPLIRSFGKQQFDKIGSLLIEYHEWNGGTKQELIDKLTSFGYDVSESDNSLFIFAKKAKSIDKNIKAVQFLLNDDHGDYPKQIQSVENLSALESHGISHVKHYNDIYLDLPPVSRSLRPSAVSRGLDRLKPDSLTPAHYGCYDSFKTIVLSEFDSDTDYLLVFEGDAKIRDMDEFMIKLNDAIGLIDAHQLDYISFGGIHDLEHGVLQSNVIEGMTEDFFVCDKIIGCQCLLFPQKFRKKFKELLRTEPWDALDIYLNNISVKHGLRVGVSRKTLVTQYDGVSAIDKVVKQFKEF